MMLYFYVNLLSISNSKPWPDGSILLYLRFMGLGGDKVCLCLGQNISSLIFCQGCRATSSHCTGLRTWFPIKHYSVWTEMAPCPHLEPVLFHPHICTDWIRPGQRQTQVLDDIGEFQTMIIMIKIILKSLLLGRLGIIIIKLSRGKIQFSYSFHLT